MELHQQYTALRLLRKTMDAFHPIESATWKGLVQASRYRTVAKGQLLYPAGQVHLAFSFVVNGLVRCYTIHESGNQYNKNFFEEGEFPVSMVSLLTGEPSEVEFETLEDTEIVEINFNAYRTLRDKSIDLMQFQINFLEQYWLLAKEAREINLIQDSATERYRKFRLQRPGLAQRLPQYHVASHLGITPTQLSRIRTSLQEGL